MAEQTFKSPGFFEREIEVISRPLFRNTATPAGVIGVASRGPAFVPTTVSSKREFIRIFGNPDQNRLGGHAVNEFFNNGGKALTFCRVLGSGVVESDGGSLVNAGFEVTGTALDSDKLSVGGVHFLVADHDVNKAEYLSYGNLSDNDSISLSFDSEPLVDTNANQNFLDDNGEFDAQLLRAVIVPHKDYSVRIFASNETKTQGDDNGVALTTNQGVFSIYLKHSSDPSKDTDIVSVSLNPERSDYIGNVLNTNSFNLESEKHLLYAHFPVDNAVADSNNKNVAIAIGSGGVGSNLNHYGEFKSAYTAPKSPKFISQPFGNKEYDLFHFESLDDGEYANFKYKISISNLTASTDPTDDFGTFTVNLRDLKDTDENPVVYESFSRCSLNPEADNFIAKVIGDQRLRMRLDVYNNDEKRLIREGIYPNNSNKIRVVVSNDVLQREVPDEALPFGFRGLPALKTTSDGKDGSASNTSLLEGVGDGSNFADGDDPQTAAGGNVNKLAFGVMPPLPYRFKVTKGDIREVNGNYGQAFLGNASSRESVSDSLHWGLLSTRVEDINNPNAAPSKLFNEILLNYTKFLGSNQSVQHSEGSDADSFNNNKFSLSKIALSLGAANSASGVNLSNVKGTVNDVFKDAVYIRNADVGSSVFDVNTKTLDLEVSGLDPFGTDNSSGTTSHRISLAKLLAEDKKKFNKYNSMAKFTAPMYGGFDGLNITDRDEYYLTDRSSSTDTGGHAGAGGFASGLTKTQSNNTNEISGTLLNNNAVASYKNAIRVMTDDMVVNHNILVVPGIREPLITDFASRRASSYGKALYVMDIPHYSTASSNSRLFVSSNGLVSGRPDAEITSDNFDARQLNSSYTATYFPDVYVQDSGDDDDAAVASRRSVRVPSSIVALGALARTDASGGLWFAPAGFSRGSLGTITSTEVRLNAEDRDTLYEARINPIANFPNNQFVIFGQKTTQLARTALDRVNVRRLVLEVKRRLETIAQGLLFEQNNAATRGRFVTAASGQLSGIQAQQGIEDFRVIMDDTNNSQEDVDNNRLNGRIVFVPTRAVEFIAIDFIVTNSGVEYPA
jgi:hypothetical protein